MNAYTGSGNGGFIYIALKPLDVRKVGAMEIINRLRPKMNRLPVASSFLQAAQDLRIGGRGSNALYQYTIQSDNIEDLSTWGPILLREMKKMPGFQDVNSDQQNGGLDVQLNYDRNTASRLGLTPSAINSGLYDAFGTGTGFAHLYAAEPVLRSDGSGPAVSADARRAECDLLPHYE